MPRSAPRRSHPTIAANPTLDGRAQEVAVELAAGRAPARTRPPTRRATRAPPPAAPATDPASAAPIAGDDRRRQRPRQPASIGPTRAANQAPSPAAATASPTGPGDDDGERPRGGPGRRRSAATGDGQSRPIVATLASAATSVASTRTRATTPAGPDGRILARALGRACDRAPGARRPCRPGRRGGARRSTIGDACRPRGSRRAVGAAPARSDDGDRRDGADQRADEPVRRRAGRRRRRPAPTGSRVSIANAAADRRRRRSSPCGVARCPADPGCSSDGHRQADERRVDAEHVADRSLGVERRAGRPVGDDPAAVHERSPAGRSGRPGRGRGGRPRSSCRRAR